MPVIVVYLGVYYYTALITFFFTWASIHVLHQINEDIFLGRIVEVELAHGNTGLAGDLPDGGAVEALPGKQGQRSPLNPQPVLGDCFVQKLGHFQVRSGNKDERSLQVERSLMLEESTSQN